MIWWLKLTCPLVIELQHGKLTCRKGSLPSSTLREIRDLLVDEGISKGHLWMQGNGRFGFSSNIPKHQHQRIRNLLAST